MGQPAHICSIEGRRSRAIGKTKKKDSLSERKRSLEECMAWTQKVNTGR